MNRRQAWLGAALLATLIATWWAATVETEPPAERQARKTPQARKARSKTTVAPMALSADALLLARAPIEAEGADLFAVKSFVPPPPPAPPPPPPPKPTAPPLPFRYLGSLMEGDQSLVYVSEGARMHVLRVGEQVDRRYRVEAIDATRVTLTFLPLDQRQELLIGRP
jgi:hypothetical protein